MVTDRLPRYWQGFFAQTLIPAMSTGMLRWHVGRTSCYRTSVVWTTGYSRKRIWRYVYIVWYYGYTDMAKWIITTSNMFTYLGINNWKICIIEYITYTCINRCIIMSYYNMIQVRRRRFKSKLAKLYNNIVSLLHPGLNYLSLRY